MLHGGRGFTQRRRVRYSLLFDLLNSRSSVFRVSLLMQFILSAPVLRQFCEWKGVNIIEAEICPDHVHMLVEIPPKIAVSSFMGYLKGKSSTIIYEQFGELKFKYRNREFWCTGYYVDTVGKNKAKIAEYIKHQLDEDRLGEQMTMVGKDSPFTGSK